MLYALEPAENIALFTTLGAILVAIVGTTIPSIIASRRSTETQETLGKVNGHGTAMDMLGKILDRQATGDGRLARLEQHQVEVHSTLLAHEARITALEKPPTQPRLSDNPG